MEFYLNSTTIYGKSKKYCKNYVWGQRDWCEFYQQETKAVAGRRLGFLTRHWNTKKKSYAL